MFIYMCFHGLNFNWEKITAITYGLYKLHALNFHFIGNIILHKFNWDRTQWCIHSDTDIYTIDTKFCTRCKDTLLVINYPWDKYSRTKAIYFPCNVDNITKDKLQTKQSLLFRAWEFQGQIHWNFNIDYKEDPSLDVYIRAIIRWQCCILPLLKMTFYAVTIFSEVQLVLLKT